MEQLSGLDAMFVRAEMHGMPMHLSSLSIYDPSSAPNGAVEFRKIIELFDTRLQFHLPFLRYRLKEVPFQLDQPYWSEDPNFDLVYHVRHIALPKPGNWAKLCSLVANLHAQPLNRERPLWEAYIIDGLDGVEGLPPGSFALLLKIHHAMMDGKSGLSMFAHLHDAIPDAAAKSMSLDLVPEIFVEHQPDLQLAGMLVRAARNNIVRTGKLIGLLGHSTGILANLYRSIKKNEFTQLHKPKTRFNGAISPRRVVDRMRVPLTEVKEIKSYRDGLTINDVALAVVGGALRHYLLAKDELPDVSLVAGVPIDIRGKGGNPSIGNFLNVTNIAIRTDIENPCQRLLQVHSDAVGGKQFARALGERIVPDVMDSLHSAIVGWAVHLAVESGSLEKFPPVNNTIVTNVAGSKVPMYFCGARMIDSFGMGPLIPNTGLFHTISSYAGQLTFAFTADRLKMDDPDFYAACLRQSFIELRDGVRALLPQRDAGKKNLPKGKAGQSRRGKQ